MTKKTPSSLKQVFDNPDFDDWDLDLIRAFSDWADAEMEKRLSREVKKIQRIRDKITRGIEIRLDILGDYKRQAASATRALAHLPNSRFAPGMIWRTADLIWKAAGDVSTDYNRYTKRLLLGGVLTAVTLYWLKDNSPGHKNTAAFLDKRIENVMQAGKFLSKFKRSA